VIPIGFARNREVVNSFVRAALFDKPQYRVEATRQRIRNWAESFVEKGASPAIVERERVLLTARVLDHVWSIADDHGDGGAA